MTKRDFFRIIIKLFGLYSATLAIFSLLPTYIGYAINEFDLITVFLAIGSLIIIVLLLIALIFGADKIINVLKLDKGYDEERIDFGNLKEINILKLAIIIMGGFLIIDNFPVFLNHCILHLKDQVSRNGNDGMLNAFTYEQVNYFQFAISAISILIGYLMITNYTNIAKWLSKTDKKNVG